MTKDEFIKNSCKMGYCNKKEAERYCEGKENFTDDDYIGVYRMAEEQQYRTYGGHAIGNGAFTTKKFFGDGGSEGNR